MSSPLSKTEKEKQKLIQEKCQTILASMLRDEDNKYCVDCDAKGPRWASWNLGIFLCIRCAGIHRNLGVHISRVKSVNLDSWTPEQVVSLQQMGNSRARAVYEANLPDNFRRPQTDSTLESFIRAKYESKKYIAKEWVCPPPLKISWDAEIELEMKRKKEAKRKVGAGSPSTGSVELPAGRSRAAEAAPQSVTPKADTQPPPPVELPPPVKASSASQDLLGLDGFSNGSSGGGNDLFGSLVSADPTPNPAPANGSTASSSLLGKNSDEDSFFNQKTPSTAEKRTLDKNSILALYNQGGATSAPVPNPLQNMFAPQGNVYQAQGGFGAAPNPSMVNPAMMGGNFNPLLQQTNMYSSPMFPTTGPAAAMQAPIGQLSQQLTGLNFGPAPVTHHNPMMPGAPLVPGMMNHSVPMQMGMPAQVVSNPNPYAYSAPGQQPPTMSTNLWQ